MQNANFRPVQLRGDAGQIKVVGRWTWRNDVEKLG
jgi:hypothetical protein